VHELAARILELRAPSAIAAIAAHYHSAGNDAAALAYAVGAAERHLTACTHDAALAALQVAQRYAPSSAELATCACGTRKSRSRPGAMPRRTGCVTSRRVAGSPAGGCRHCPGAAAARGAVPSRKPRGAPRSDACR
jgi:hypothetical protein